MVRPSQEEELWQALEDQWDPVRRELAGRLQELTSLLALPSATPAIEVVREVQGRIAEVQGLIVLPATKLEELKKGNQNGPGDTKRGSGY